MRILALDLGTRTGYAVGCSSSMAYCGTLDLRPRRFEGGGMRYLRFRHQLADLLDGVHLVAFEEVRRHLGTDAAHVYGGLVAVLTEECERREIPYEAVPVGTIKRHATGRGNADKAAMLDAARHRWPDETITYDDEADALWLLDLAHYLHNTRTA